jgi:hypothetical protein
MADELATQFTKTSDNTQYTQQFRRKKDQEEKEPIQIQVDYRNKELYNSLLTEEEKIEAFAGCARSSPDPDHIHYEFIKKMARPEKIKIPNAQTQDETQSSITTKFGDMERERMLEMVRHHRILGLIFHERLH